MSDSSGLGWKPIEQIAGDNPIWVIKYDLFFLPDGNFCDGNHPDGIKFTDCHGWYESEEDVLKVLRHFPRPNTYRVEKVNKRILIQND